MTFWNFNICAFIFRHAEPHKVQETVADIFILLV